MSEAGAAASLDRIGCGRFAVAMFLIAGLGWISDGAEAAVLSYMLPVLEARFAATEAMLGPITSLLAGAQALGAAFWGSLADRAGRRKAFLCSVGLTAVFGLASAWAWSLPSYVGLRALTGFAIGGNLPLAVMVTSELLPPKIRDRALVGLHLFYEIGALSSTGAALVLMPNSCMAGTRCDWPTYLSIMGLPAAVVSLVALCYLPESPVWLESQGRHQAAQHVIARAAAGRSACDCGCRRLLSMQTPCARGGSEDMSPLDAAPTMSYGSSGTDPDAAPEATSDACQQPTADAHSSGPECAQAALFGRTMLRTTVCVTALWFTADAASGWWTWLPTVAAAQHVPASIMYAASIVGRVVASCAFIVAAIAIGYIPSRTLLLFCILFSAVFSGVLTFFAVTPPLFDSAFFILAYGGFALFFGGLWSLMYVVTPLRFPPNLRGSGFGLASAFSKLGQLTAPLIVGPLVASSVFAVGAFFTCAFLLASLCLFLTPRNVPSIEAR